MKKTVLIWNPTTNTYDYLRTEEATPVCGEDFCDGCGDCLSCDWEDPCYGNDMGGHTWVEYINDNSILDSEVIQAQQEDPNHI